MIPPLLKWANTHRLAVAIGLLVIVGLIGLAFALPWWIAVVALLVAVLVSFATFNEIAGRVLGAIIVGMLVLFGINVVVENVLSVRMEIRVGLAFAVVVFGVSAGWYLRGVEGPQSTLGRGTRWGVWTASVAAGALSVFLLLDVPIIVARGKHSALSVFVGLCGALVLVGLGVWCRRKRERVPPLQRYGGIVAPLLGVILLAVVPIVVQRERDRPRTVPDREQVPSRIDVRIVTDGSVHSLPEPAERDPALGGFEVSYSVGFADGRDVRWTLVNAPDLNDALRVASLGRDAPLAQSGPVLRAGADGVLALLVDGTPPLLSSPPNELPRVRASSREVGRWRRIARAAGGAEMATFPLLQTDRRARLDRWRLFSRNGEPISVQRFGRRAATDASVALSIGAPTAQADLALAIVHRPILLFDTKEPVPRPLSIGWLFGMGKITLCRDHGVTSTQCDDQPTTDSTLLESNETHLELEAPADDLLQKLAAREEKESLAAPLDDPGPAAVPPVATPVPADGDEPETAIYVNAVPARVGRRDLVYLDYWWYLPTNPVSVGLKAFCGAGLVIPGITCHDHPSDWEGMTVVVDRTSGRPRVDAVHYAEHDDVVRIPWDELRAMWDDDADIRSIIAESDNGAARPLAFVAKGTHSTYPLPCPRKRACEQIASGVREDPHHGTRKWIGNFTNVCGTSTCVHRLPTRAGGHELALWNAFKGVWGKQTCALTYYCDSAKPPHAPGQQKRYKDPGRCTGNADRHLTFKSRPCL